MMEYLYSGSIANFNPSVALDLLGLADAYMLEGLKYLCENTLMHNVDNDNVCALLIDANKYSSTELKKFCINYLIKNFSEVQILTISVVTNCVAEIRKNRPKVHFRVSPVYSE